ncbi:MAG: TrbI/VirB10 family protein [Bdellovibrionales bacterium]|nr:TrbI/VirB10 family protein [Bdellovibrionales bacterium]
MLREEGGKRVVNRRRATLVGLLLGMVGMTVSLLPTIFSGDGGSRPILKSDVPLVGAKTESVLTGDIPKAESQVSIGGISNHTPTNVNVMRSARPPTIVRYRAKQVIGPDGSADRIPAGANFIGKLLKAIDTRAPSDVQIILPYGGGHESGGTLPKDTILFGQAGYSGRGSRVYINFDRGVLPDGTEISIRARALNSKDYSVGIEGDFHSNTGNRVASVLGLSMVSGMSEVLIEKEALGQTFEATPKANLSNAFYNGLAKVTQMEAGIQAEKLAQTPEYVIVDAGTDLILSLTSSYRPSERRQ